MSEWEIQAALWRDPEQIVSHWADASSVSPKLLQYTTVGRWWETLADLGITLLVTREYEHLVVALTVDGDEPQISFLPMPHPSGIAVDRDDGRIYLASTRNPNQIFELTPQSEFLSGRPVSRDVATFRPLMPTRSRLLPGALYIHELATIGGTLYANAVGENAIIRLEDGGGFAEAWWPKCVDRDGAPAFDKNYIQLNSIAAGSSLMDSYFSASSDSISVRRPGHLNYPVDGRGVIFAGETRDPCVRGLTRPHSARLHHEHVWVDNSGYGELVIADPREESYQVAARLPGWTRGLSFVDDVAFVGTSRVIPRFKNYAPGLNFESSVCGVHAVATNSGAVLGSCIWPTGNQVFAVEWISKNVTSGFPFGAGIGRHDRDRLFSAFRPN
jgi:uncharacterized protein (TIGR03032 family)